MSTEPNLHEILAAKVLAALVSLAEIPVEEGFNRMAVVDELQGSIAAELHEQFNNDMKSCIVIRTSVEFSLEPKVVGLNILPHFSNFIADQITKGLTQYSRHGVPMKLELHVDDRHLGLAVIHWAYSMEGVDVVAPE